MLDKAGCTGVLHDKYRLGLTGACTYHSGRQENMHQIKKVHLLQSDILYSTAPFFLYVTMDRLVQDEPMPI